MELQQRTYSCGPSAVRAALYMLGRNVLEATIRKWALTTPKDGTDEKGIIRAINHYGYNTREYQSGSARKSWAWLKHTLSTGRPVIICADQWGHWCSVVGTFGGKVLVFDPDRIPGKRRRYSGLRLYDEQKLASRWKYTENQKDYYYAISIIP